MKKQFFTLLLLLVMGVTQALAQQTVKGTVVDMSDEPLIGVSALIDGTNRGTSTDINGQYELRDVPSNATIRFSYFGMKPQAFKVDGRSVIDVKMYDDTQNLDEVVVIGYGSAKAKDLTAPITVVQGDEIAGIPTSSPMGALTGKVPGVNILNSGTPGDGPTVQIRGIGSFSASSPLYVVDGVFYDNINFLNNDDIQEMSILKDASAAAIYGVKAANGVVIITTKRGKKHQQAKITYNGYVGVQHATNVLKMCDSHEYATMLMEGNPEAYKAILESSIAQFGGSMSNLTFGANTNWYDELLRDAVITNHSLNISGGSDNATYSVGLSYLYQNGIMKTDNDYKRLNFRAQLDYDATNWLKVGFNGVFSNARQQTPNAAAWQQAFNTPGLIPVYDANQGDNVFPEKFASPQTIGLMANFYNPIATATYYNSFNQNYQVLSNFFADLIFIPGKLDLRTSYGYDYSNIKGTTVTEPYYVSDLQNVVLSGLTKSNTQYNKWVWDNILTYKDNWGEHGFGAMVGYSMREDRYNYLSGSVKGINTEKPEYWYLNLGDQDTATSTDGGWRTRSQSVFGRLNYDYAGKYLITFTMRADGTSKYQEKWGYFPSIGGAWVMSSEPFMQGQTWADYLKIRASWGRLGNDNVAASDGFASLSYGNSNSGVFGNSTYPGYQDNSYFSWLKWEVVSETNVGVQFATLNNRLSLDLDYFYRLTSNAVISPLLAFSNQTLAGNYGKIENQGIDLTLNWSDRVGKFKYNIGATISTLRNRVKDLNGHPAVHGGQVTNMVGERMNSYYGYKVIGVFQTQEEINNYKTTLTDVSTLQPGDFIYEDTNGDGIVDGDDRQCLGSYIPSFSYGINFSCEWNGLDFSLSTFGQAGAQLWNRKRALRYAAANYNFDHAQYADRWTGPGSTNSNPSAAALMKSYNIGLNNSYFVESADFFRIQNISLGYTLRNIDLGGYVLPSVRFSLTADRPFSWFSANAFTPELTDPMGWDTQVYPLSSTYTFGLQVEF